MDRPVPSDVPLHPLLAMRYSPRAFSDRPVDSGALHRIFEAARWSASCFNEQPWRFIVGRKNMGDAWERILGTLLENNQRWAKNAPVLVILLAKPAFSHNDKPNNWHQYDGGQAAAHMTFQALHEGIFLHQMAGFDPQKAIEEFAVPADVAPISAIAIGYPGLPEDLPEDLRERETAQRVRRPLAELVFSGSWGSPVDFL